MATRKSKNSSPPEIEGAKAVTFAQSTTAGSTGFAQSGSNLAGQHSGPEVVIARISDPFRGRKACHPSRKAADPIESMSRYDCLSLMSQNIQPHLGESR